MKTLLCLLCLAASLSAKDPKVFASLTLSDNSGKFVFQDASWLTDKDGGKQFGADIQNTTKHKISYGEVIFVQYRDLDKKEVADKPTGKLTNFAPKTTFHMDAAAEKGNEGCVMVLESVTFVLEEADGTRKRFSHTFEPKTVLPIWYNSAECAAQHKQSDKNSKK
jgi:hypothetical protein